MGTMELLGRPNLRATIVSEGPFLIATLVFTVLSLLGAKPLGVGVDLGLLGFAAGIPFFARATYDAIVDREINAELTMVISGAGALLLGQFAAASIVSFMAITTHLIEEFTTEKGARDLTALVETTPTVANKWDVDGSLKRVPAKSLMPGDIVVVREGELISVDGRIEEGLASIAESSLTGEPLPVTKQKGSHVLAGTKVTEGYLKIRVEKLASESYILTLVREVSENIQERPPAKRFVDTVAVYFMPLILGLTVLVFLITGSGTAAVAMLVIASPCAVLAATPLAFLATSAKLARRGVVIKDGEVLRRIGHVDVIIFDKTGTLTIGKPKVETVKTFAEFTSDQILSLAASCEVPSPHPIAAAIVNLAGQRNIGLHPLEEFRSEVGKGVVAKLNGMTYRLGQVPWLIEEGIQFNGEVDAVLSNLSSDSGIPIVLTEEKRPVGLIYLKDELRQSAVEMISGLKALGVKEVLLLTGDRNVAALETAGRLGISFKAELTPNEKAGIVKELRKAGHTVAFIGDGVNDAPALSESNVSIAIAPDGATVASQVADIILTRANLEVIPEVIRTSKRAINAIYQNIAVFLLVNILGLAFAGVGVITPISGAVLHGIQETFGFVNSSRLARKDFGEN